MIAAPLDSPARAAPVEEALERPPCPLCGAGGQVEGVERAKGVEGPEAVYGFPPYGVVRCRHCALWYLSPRRAEERMRESYAHDSYFEGSGLGYSSYLAQEGTLRLTFRRFLSGLARRGVGGGRLLEIGCAYGFFLDEARSFFSHRAGTDYSAAAVAIAATRAEEVWLGGLDAVPDGEGAFDCVACIHVIEHIYQPRPFLAEALRHLRPGGWVVLATPDMGSFWRPLLRRRWPFFKVPEHVTYFDRRSLRRLLRDAGCQGVRLVPYASVFSLEMIGEKLGLTLPGWLTRLRLWLPATTIAAIGQKPRE